jgi:hypothetical protein
MLAALALPSVAQQPSPADRIAALKANVELSQAVLRQYEWIETTVITVKGDEKSRKQARCYYGADGGLQKVDLSSTPPSEKKRGLRGKIAENKQEEMTDYMKDAVALVKMYVPPNPARIQAVKDAGKVSVTPLPGQRARLTFADYIKPGDSLTLDVDLATSRPIEAKVATYLDKKEPVTLSLQFSTLDNNSTYPATVILVAQAKDLGITLQNGGYRKVGN